MKKPLHFPLAAKFVFLLSQIFLEISVLCRTKLTLYEEAFSVLQFLNVLFKYAGQLLHLIDITLLKAFQFYYSASCSCKILAWSLEKSGYIGIVLFNIIIFQLL